MSYEKISLLSDLIFTSLRPALCPDSKEMGFVVTTGFQARTILSLLPVTIKFRLKFKKENYIFQKSMRQKSMRQISMRQKSRFILYTVHCCRLLKPVYIFHNIALGRHKEGFLTTPATLTKFYH